jgi:hypothetical protein
VIAIVAAALARQPSRRDEGEEIARRFPAAHLKETEPEHLLTAQRSTTEAHREAIAEARREAHLPP